MQFLPRLLVEAVRGIGGVVVFRRILGNGTVERRTTVRSPMSPMNIFKPLEGPKALPFSKGRIKTLRYDAQDIEMWTNYTAFSEVQTFVSHGYATSAAIQALNRNSQSTGFQSLRHLNISLEMQDEEGGNDYMDKEIRLLLQASNPLQFLGLTNIVSKDTFNTVLNRHGPSLKWLKLIPGRLHYMLGNPFIISDDLIKELVLMCPHIEELEILVPRTNGDDHEVSIYRTLGRMPRLKRVSLHLHCSKYDTREAAEDEEAVFLPDTDNKLPSSTLREIMINCAIDSTLARSIFHTIAGEGGIEYVELKPHGMGSFHFGQRDTQIADALRWIARTWVCKKDGSGGGVILRERYRSPCEAELLMNNFHGHHDVKRVWTDLWPGLGEDWTKQWSSFPLACSSAGLE